MNPGAGSEGCSAFAVLSVYRGNHGDQRGSNNDGCEVQDTAEISSCTLLHSNPPQILRGPASYPNRAGKQIRHRDATLLTDFSLARLACVPLSCIPSHGHQTHTDILTLSKTLSGPPTLLPYCCRESQLISKTCLHFPPIPSSASSRSLPPPPTTWNQRQVLRARPSPGCRQHRNRGHGPASTCCAHCCPAPAHSCSVPYLMGQGLGRT